MRILPPLQQRMITMILPLVLFLLGATLAAPALYASPTMSGQTGLVSMPSARIEENGALRFGLSRYFPYTTMWSSLSMFPRLELGARYTAVDNTVGLPSNPGFGTFKDKAFDAKLLFLQESKYFPALSVGSLDFLGTQVFDAEYIVASKRIGPLDFSLGYGRGRIDGVFGGFSYRPKWAKRFEFVYEYDAFNYKEDRFANTHSVYGKLGGSTYAVNYHWGWLGVQVAYQESGEYGINGFVSIPLMQREFIPKLHEPAPFSLTVNKPTIVQWQADTNYKADLVIALEAQGFKNVQLLINNNQLEIGFSTRNITLVGRAVGRVVRTALLMGPKDITNIKVTYITLTDLALVTYDFHNLSLLTQFFEGSVTYGELLKGMSISYADPATARLLSDASELKEITEKQNKEPIKEEQLKDEPTRKEFLQWVPNEEGHAISLRHDDSALSRFRLIPFNLGVYFNDVNGPLRYDIFALAKYTQHLSRGLFFDSSVRLTLLEDVSEVVDQSNSVLPHVRSEVAEYKRDSHFKLNNLMLNKFLQLQPRLYSRLSIGYYEEMYGGLGGQLLYMPKQSSWAIDLAVDQVRQRNTDGGFGFREYTTTTAIAAFHYQLPKYGVTFTLRGGQFLAKDKGVRYEIKRRFRSGVRIGAWYTSTDGKDITSPGSPDDPYMDKGIFVSIPFGSMLTKDTRSKANFAISPWTRDVGQMVKTPGDLYEIMEDPLMLDWQGHHLLSGFHE